MADSLFSCHGNQMPSHLANQELKLWDAFSLWNKPHSKGRFKVVDEVIQEHFELDHAEVVPVADLNKPPSQVFYFPMHVVQKESSATTKVRAVFNASDKSTINISLNDTLFVGPTIHPLLIDVLLRFRFPIVVLIADVSKMYHAIQLANWDKDLHEVFKIINDASHLWCFPLCVSCQHDFEAKCSW